MYRIAILLIATFILSSCSQKKESGVNRKQFEDTEELKAEKIDFDAPLYPLSFTILKDSLILACNWDGEPNYAELYSLKSKKLITKFALKGKGPNEFLSANIIYRNPADSYFGIMDIVKSTVSRFDIDSLVLLKDKYVAQVFSLPSYSKDVAFEDNKHAIIFNSDYLRTEKYNNEVKSALERIDLSSDLKTKVDSSKIHFFSPNVTGGYVLVSPSTDAVWVANYYEDRIDIYNKKLEFQRSLSGPDHIKPEYLVQDPNMLTFGGYYYRSYYPSLVTKDAVYLIYLGVNKVSNDANFEKPVEVFKLSWSGKLLANYKLDKFIHNISIDSKGEYLYGSYVKKSGDYPILVRYKIK